MTFHCVHVDLRLRWLTPLSVYLQKSDEEEEEEGEDEGEDEEEGEDEDEDEEEPARSSLFLSVRGFSKNTERLHEPTTCASLVPRVGVVSGGKKGSLYLARGADGTIPLICGGNVSRHHDR